MSSALVLTIMGRATEQDSGCITTDLSTNGSGYAQVREPGQGRLRYAHRIMYEWFVGNPPAGKVLHHSCFLPSCVNPLHLQPLTEAEHREEHGRAQRESTPLCRKCGSQDWKEKASGKRYCAECNRVANLRWRTKREDQKL